MQMAIDRKRFSRRIIWTEKIIAPILSEEHRLGVLTDRLHVRD
jgi:hypothetical protein